VIPLAGKPGSAHRTPELDGLRFFAVAGVMFVHFSPNFLANFAPWGEWGVRFFFVLSGFFITRLLLAGRARLEARLSTPTRELGEFCARRALRLWPIYFLTIFGTAVFNLSYAREMFLWNVLFASNYYVAITLTWPDMFSHLWTLAVEQQFYLLWPFVVLGVRSSTLRGIVIMLIVAGPLFRGMELVQNSDDTTSMRLLPACVDFFAWGALMVIPSPTSFISSMKIFFERWAGIAAAVLGIVCLIGFHLDGNYIGYWSYMEGSVTAISATFLILHCINHQDSWFKRFSRISSFVYLGRISYGIYLYHNFSHWIGPAILRRIHSSAYFSNEILHFSYYTIISILMAVVSWYLLELRLEKMRRRLFN
jgi:peptidoglycan/LPS O-acetylase OafA/YrhL